MISTHILDTSKGNPASKVQVTLDKLIDSKWNTIGDELTNDDGRIAFNCPNEKGVYRLTFMTEDYFGKNDIDSFFVTTPVIFKITNTERKYHVPLLLNPFGYSTYRGS